MGRLSRGSRPSSAIAVAVLALVAALAGTALAGPQATTSAINKKKVKKIASKQIHKLAPDLSVANANSLGGKPASNYASSASEPYREVDTPGQPQFQPGWSNNGGGFSTTAFYKDSQGVVHLKGTLSTSTDATVAFTLPSGYRPSQALSLPVGSVESTRGGGTMTIRPNGEVLPDCTPGGTSVCHPGIDGLTFRVP
jgi:hypothetical protein